MTAFAHNAPIGEFIAWLRDWAIRQGANYLLIDKIDQLGDTVGANYPAQIDALEQRATMLEDCRDSLVYALEDLIPHVDTDPRTRKVGAQEAVTLARQAMEDAK